MGAIERSDDSVLVRYCETQGQVLWRGQRKYRRATSSDDHWILSAQLPMLRAGSPIRGVLPLGHNTIQHRDEKKKKKKTKNNPCHLQSHHTQWENIFCLALSSFICQPRTRHTLKWIRCISAVINKNITEELTERGEGLPYEKCVCMQFLSK